MSFQEKLHKVDEIAKKIDSFGGISNEIFLKINYKFRLDWNYYSNQMEGNTLTKEETRSVMVGNITVGGKPLKDVIEMTGHDEVISEILKIGKGEQRLSEQRIKDIHKAIMHEDNPEKRKNIGNWKKEQNYVINYKGEKHEFTPPSSVVESIHNLLNTTNAEIDKLKQGKAVWHSVEIALNFHLNYISIHPFYDGNGRTARILTNLLLISFGYPPILLKTENKNLYYQLLADIQCYGGNHRLFFEFMTEQLLQSQCLVLNVLEGGNIDEDDDFDKEIELLKRRQSPEIKKSNQIIKEVLKNVYFPFLNELNNSLLKLNKLFLQSYWNYFEEPELPKYEIPFIPKKSSLKELTDYFYVIPDKFGESHTNFKATYCLIDYNDTTKFSLEIALRIHFSDDHYHVEVSIGKPLHSTLVGELLNDITTSITQNKAIEFNKFDFPQYKYSVPTNKGELKNWSKEITKRTLNILKEKSSEK